MQYNLQTTRYGSESTKDKLHTLNIAAFGNNVENMLLHRKTLLDDIDYCTGWKEVTVTSRRSGTVIWKVVAAVESEDVIPERSAGKKCRCTGFDIGSHKKVKDLLRNFYPFPF